MGVVFRRDVNILFWGEWGKTGMVQIKNNIYLDQGSRELGIMSKMQIPPVFFEISFTKQTVEWNKSSQYRMLYLWSMGKKQQ